MKIIFIAILLVVTSSLTVSNAVCSCAQLLSETECRSNKCYWDGKKCNTYTAKTTSFCELQLAANCSKTDGCALASDKCVSFSGCKVYTYTTHDVCQNVSIRCTSDGTRCIELDQCVNYPNQTSCLKDENGKLCYWKDTACIQPTTCDQLPLALNTDALCRAEISTCTMKDKGGCITSADKCEGQIIIGACVTDLAGTKACIWDTTGTGSCKEKTCANSPNTNNTHDLCTKYLATCTVNDTLDGCQDRPALCTALKTLSNCFLNSAGNTCYWNANTSKCEDKNCDNATIDYQNDAKCREWLSTCTVKVGGIGCLTRPATCEELKEMGQCVTNLAGDTCFWNGTTCVTKNCTNALDSNINNDMCSTYLATCTVQTDLTGCELKKVKCTDYTAESQCVSQLDGTLCVFQDSKCIERTCPNASQDLTTDLTCKSFSPTCMLAPSSKGCVLQTCTNILYKEDCKTDYQNKTCYYGQLCQLRSCDNAPQSYTSDDQCRKFLSTCTVADDLTGCKLRPTTCAELNEQQCKPLSSGQKCSWNNTDNNQACRNLDCADIPPDSQTNATCSAFDASCTVAENPSVCMPKPNGCGNMLASDHCLSVVLFDLITTCSWDPDAQICRNRTCTDAPITIITEADCRAFLNSCTLNAAKQGCVSQPATCKGFTSQDTCIKLNAFELVPEVLCGWNGCENRTCQNAPALTTSVYSHVLCNTYLNTCTVNTDRSGCVSSFVTCGDIVNNELQCNDTVLQDKVSKCYYDTTGSNPVCRPYTCTDTTAFSITHAYCSALLSTCTLGINAAGCVPQFTQCSSITDSVQCEGTKLVGNGQCSWDATTTPSTPVCVDRACAFSSNKAKASDCETYLSSCTLGATDGGCITKPTACNGLDQSQCNNVKLVAGTLCSFDNTQSVTNLQCRDRVCADAPTVNQTDAQCRAWLSTCTVTADEAGCISEPADCTLMTRSQCFQQNAKSTLCYWNTSANPASCRAALCTDASKTTYTSDALCVGYISTCTVGPSGGCITKPTACASLDQNHCPKVTISAAGKEASQNKCSWSAISSLCQDRACVDAPSTIVTEAVCRTWLPSCTLGHTNQGCVAEATSCLLVQTLNQCQILSNGTKCGWNIGCVNRTCSNAPDSLTTDDMCTNYLSTCTVQADGTGCVTRAAKCSDILVQIQCTKANVLCQWNTKTVKCEDRSCTNAATTLTTHDDCNKYYNLCTVKPSGAGCQSKLEKCLSYTTIGQCVITTSNSKCQWIINYSIGSCVDVWSDCSTYSIQPSCTKASDGTQCIWIDGSCYSRQCSHAPKSYSTHDQCKTFAPNCTTNGKGCIAYQPCSTYTIASSCVKGSNGDCTLIDQCQNITCNSAPITYKSDQECTSFLRTCTTNGTGCVDRKRCQDAYIEEACKTNSDGNECAWVNSVCMDKTCNTAPTITKTEKDCESYFPGGRCTPIKDGGCTQKNKCQDAQIEAACTTSYDGLKCSWQNSTCKLKSCTDLLGYDHVTCNAQQINCTTNGYNCVAMQTCSSTIIQAACVRGTDGPCLWSNNQCYKYTKCTDLIYSTHEECNNIHPQCTSNGINCIAISTCAETPRVGCYLGINDGVSVKCIWTPASIKLSAPYVCTPFTQCSDAFYLTHQDCFNYSLGQCTTDGTSGCIALDVCTNYTVQVACNIDLNGTVTKANLVTATGICKWSEEKCVAQGCADLSGTSHADCHSALGTCTYNGTKCVVQGTCSTYNSTIPCTQATGTDGKCIWDNNACSAMKCADYPVTLCSMYSSTCIQDGTVCVAQTDCANYKTQSACDFGSPTGVCAWIATTTSSKGKCLAVTSCTVATAYQKACDKLSDRCYWQTIKVANVVEHICAAKTCELQVDGTCTGFYDWDVKTYTICQYNTAGKCAAADPTALKKDQCPSLSLYQYTWNPTTNKCAICNTPAVTNNNTTTTNDTNQTVTKGVILPCLILVLLIGLI